MTQNETIRLIAVALLAAVGTYALMPRAVCRLPHAKPVLQNSAPPEAKSPEVPATLAVVAPNTPAENATDSQARKILEMKQTAELLALKPCQAKLRFVNPCTGVFEIGNGQELHLGGPFTSRPIFSFLRTLEKDQTYPMPAAFIEFLDKGTWKRDEARKPEHYVDEKF